MISFLLAGAIGLVASSRWAAGAWILLACPVTLISLLADGSLESKALSLVGMVASYNLGLLMGLLLSHLVSHPNRADVNDRVGAVTRFR